MAAAVAHLIRRYFLIDGIGALVSCAAIFGAHLAGDFFGIPPRASWMLSGIALVFAVYSLTHYFMRNEQPSRLRLIAIGNLSYAMLTTSMLVFLYACLTVWGWLYFLGEIGLLLILAAFEMKKSRGQASHS